MERNQFTFYRSFYKAVTKLKPTDQAKTLLAICAYALDGVEPDLDDTPGAIFELIRPNLDSSAHKAANRLNKQQSNEEQTKIKSKSNRNQIKSNEEQTVKENENEEERENKRENKRESECKRERESENKCYNAHTRFVPPTASEVQAYCLERGNSVDAQHFVDWYTMKGWIVGKDQMQDWKAAVRTWEQRNGGVKSADRGTTVEDGVPEWNIHYDI